jgi:hypothetical protein
MYNDIAVTILVGLLTIMTAFLVYKIVPSKPKISALIAERMATEKQLSEFSDDDLMAELRKRLSRRDDNG